MTKWLRFLRFLKIQKTWLLRFFQMWHTFSRTLVRGTTKCRIVCRNSITATKMNFISPSRRGGSKANVQSLIMMH